MANYISIKGWLECEYDDINLIKSIISEYAFKKSYDTLMDYDIRTLYNKGWHFQEEVINWTSYIFYGADMKKYCLKFIKDELFAIAKVNDAIEGLFFIDDEEGESILWKISDGKLIVKNNRG